jgi:hypothetical protein
MGFGKGCDRETVFATPVAPVVEIILVFATQHKIPDNGLKQTGAFRLETYRSTTYRSAGPQCDDPTAGLFALWRAIGAKL